MTIRVSCQHVYVNVIDPDSRLVTVLAIACDLGDCSHICLHLRCVSSRTRNEGEAFETPPLYSGFEVLLLHGGCIQRSTVPSLSAHLPRASHALDLLLDLGHRVDSELYIPQEHVQEDPGKGSDQRSLGKCRDSTHSHERFPFTMFPLPKVSIPPHRPYTARRSPGERESVTVHRY